VEDSSVHSCQERLSQTTRSFTASRPVILARRKFVDILQSIAKLPPIVILRFMRNLDRNCATAWAPFAIYVGHPSYWTLLASLRSTRATSQLMKAGEFEAVGAERKYMRQHQAKHCSAPRKKSIASTTRTKLRANCPSAVRELAGTSRCGLAVPCLHIPARSLLQGIAPIFPIHETKRGFSW